MRQNRRLFTSESVTEGHPDKICDQISDAILDAILEQDPASRVACEVAITTGLVVVMGEITTRAYVDIQRIVRETIRSVGYDKAEYGLAIAPWIIGYSIFSILHISVCIKFPYLRI